MNYTSLMNINQLKMNNIEVFIVGVVIGYYIFPVLDIIKTIFRNALVAYNDAKKKSVEIIESSAKIDVDYRNDVVEYISDTLSNKVGRTITLKNDGEATINSYRIYLDSFKTNHVVGYEELLYCTCEKDDDISDLLIHEIKLGYYLPEPIIEKLVVNRPQFKSKKPIIKYKNNEE